MKLSRDYKKARKKLILLDYDGTLVNFCIQPQDAKPSVRLLNILYKLSRDPSAKVVIITGREYRSIDSLIGHLPIAIIAEHGAMMKENGMWNDRIRMDKLWKHEFLPKLYKFTELCKGSFVEEKRFGLAWHYRNVDLMSGYIYSRDLIREVREQVSTHELRLIDGQERLEIHIAEATKGKVVSDLLESCNYDFVLCVGDGLTDEEMFEALKGRIGSTTIKVGYGKTAADHKLDTPAEVIQLLERL